MKYITLLSLLTLHTISIFAIKIDKAFCEREVNPIVVNASHPTFGWTLTSDKQGDAQTAYQIIIATDRKLLNEKNADVWNSKKIKSNTSQFINYAGTELKAGQRYYWQVKVWDSKGKASEWSETQQFDKGLQPNDWKAQWIGAITKADANLPEGRHFHKWGMPKAKRAVWDSVAPLARKSILLRKEINVTKTIERAMVYVSGLGHYELTINGSKIGESEFAPLWTDYDKTVYYNSYDLTAALRSGNNAVGVLLGNGMYNITGNRYIKFWISFGPPTLKLQMHITYTDGSSQTIASDDTWKYSESPVTFNCIYGGEDYDATKEQSGWDKPAFNDQDWKPAVIQEGPKGTLTGQTAPAVKIMSTFGVKQIKHAIPGRILLDMGQNLSGFPAIKIKGAKGQTIKLIVGELTNGDTLASQKQTGGPHYYKYTCKGEGIESWHPRFSYYGYQYIQVEGANYKDCPRGENLPELLEIESCFVHSSATQNGSFSCSNELFNQVHVLINNAIKSNMQSVFTDCPHREKLGWLEQTHLVGPGIICNYDVANLYRKVQNDMADAQLSDGLVPDIAPEYTQFTDGFRDSPEWGSSAIINPWMYYEYYGDSSLITHSYDMMKRYFNYLVSKSDSCIVSHGLGDWYDFGEHRAGPSMNTPIPLTATAYFYHCAVLMQKSAELTGNSADIKYFSEWAGNIKDAFNKKFYNPATQQYATGSQVSNAMALYFNLVEPQNKEAVLANLISDIKARGNRLTSGDVGNRYLFQTLATNDRNDVMYDMNNHYEVPGYGFQIQLGVTTLTENWDPRKGASWNHFMMGQIEEWFFKSIAGISPDTNAPGYKHFFVSPAMVGDLKWAKGSVASPYGQINTSWTKEDGKMSITVNVPVNTTATIIFENADSKTITINGQSTTQIKNLTLENQGNKTMINVPSGNYTIIGKNK